MRYDHRSKRIILEEPGTKKDYILINNRDKFLDSLTEGSEHTGKGGNSSVFKVIDCNQEEDDQVIKFCRFFHPKSDKRFIEKKIARFEREITALNKALELDKNDFIVKILGDGRWKDDNERIFRYYIMERADLDLYEFLSANVLTLQAKIQLCFELIEALKALHEIEIYHRDIKPDNIFFIDGRWKIGDLGLIRFRGEDEDIDESNEKIGPYGFLSPEAVNKALGNKELEDFSFDCEIDDKSDVFQIGKLLWYIIQGEVPTGQISIVDFKLTKEVSFFETVIIPSLQFSKLRRPDIKQLYENIVPICKKMAII